MEIRCKKCGERLPVGSIRCWRCETEVGEKPVQDIKVVQQSREKNRNIILWGALLILAMMISYVSLNTPVRMVKNYYKAAFNKDADQFLKLFAEEEVERYARNRGYTEIQMKEWAQGSVNVLGEQLGSLGVSQSDFSMSTPTGFIGKKFTYVRVAYSGMCEEIPTFIYMPLERTYLGKWVFPISDDAYGRLQFDYIDKEAEQEALREASMIEEETIPGGDNQWDPGVVYSEEIAEDPSYTEECTRNYYEMGPILDEEAAKELFLQYAGKQGLNVIDYYYRKGKVIYEGQYIHFISAMIEGEEKEVLYGVDDETGAVFDDRNAS